MVEVVIYKRINSCLAAFFQCKPSELDDVDGYFETMFADGSRSLETNRVAIKGIRKMNAWGWAEGKERIHVFVRKKATTREIISLFAHELGHLERPWHRSLIEERKASQYARVAEAAHELTARLQNGERGEFVVEYDSQPA